MQRNQRPNGFSQGLGSLMSALAAMSADARQEPLDNARIRYLDADTAINENKLMRQRQMYDAMGTVTSNANTVDPTLDPREKTRRALSTLLPTLLSGGSGNGHLANANNLSSVLMLMNGGSNEQAGQMNTFAFGGAGPDIAHSVAGQNAISARDAAEARAQAESVQALANKGALNLRQAIEAGLNQRMTGPVLGLDQSVFVPANSPLAQSANESGMISGGVSPKVAAGNAINQGQPVSTARQELAGIDSERAIKSENLSDVLFAGANGKTPNLMSALVAGAVPSNTQMSNVVGPTGPQIVDNLKAIGMEPVLSETDAKGLGLQSGTAPPEPPAHVKVLIDKVFPKMSQLLAGQRTKSSGVVGLVKDATDILEKDGTNVIGAIGKLRSRAEGLKEQAKAFYASWGGDETNQREIDTFADEVFSGSELGRLALANAEIKSVLVSLAYATAKAQDEGGRLSDNDVKLALQQIGGDLQSSGKMAGVLASVANRALRNYNVNVQSSLAQFGGDAQDLKDARKYITDNFGTMTVEQSQQASTGQPQTQAGGREELLSAADRITNQIGN